MWLSVYKSNLVLLSWLLHMAATGTPFRFLIPWRSESIQAGEASQWRKKEDERHSKTANLQYLVESRVPACSREQIQTWAKTQRPWKESFLLRNKDGTTWSFQPRKTLKTSGLESKMREVAHYTWGIVSERYNFILMSHTEKLSCSI